MTTTRVRAAARLHLLSAKEVENAREGDHSDGGGLLLRVRGSSTAWVFRYTALSGKRREQGLGPAERGNVKQAGASLTSARDVAHKARELLRQGIDPIDARDRQRDAERQAVEAKKATKKRENLTLARAARDYHRRVIEPRLSPKHAAQWISSLENHIPAELWHAPIASIEAPPLLRALAQVKPHERARNITSARGVPETLRRIRQRLDAVFEDAIFHGHCASNPAAAVRRKMRETLPKKAGRQFAALNYRDAPALAAKLREAEGTAARCLEFAMLTAARTGEALHAAWSEFDLDAATWTIPAERMKSSGKETPEPHTVFLSPRAVQIVEAQRGYDDTLVFPTPLPGHEGKPMSNMAMLATLDRLGYRARTTVHGLCRATFSTWANETGAARPDVIEACLAHREQDRVRAAYNRARFNQERGALMVAWATYLAREQTGADVIPLKAA